MRTSCLLAVTMLVSCTSATTEPTAGSSPVDEAAQLEQSVLHHEELIADCMRQRGFDYIAHVPADVRYEQAIAADLARGGDGDIDFDSVAVDDDPNLEILNTLSGTERASYDQAFWGNDDGSDLGCYGSTYEAAWGLSPVVSPSQVAEIDQVLQRIDSDARVVAARGEFVQCINRAGFAIESESDFDRVYDEVLDEVKGDARRQGIDYHEHPDFSSAVDARDRLWNIRIGCRDQGYGDIYNAVHDEYINNHYNGESPSADRGAPDQP